MKPSTRILITYVAICVVAVLVAIAIVVIR
jgi:hypothetical protein